VVSFKPEPGEKILLDEDCAEDRLKNGILILTDRRLVFQKTQGRIATLSKKETEILLDIPLDKISSVRSEGFLVKKLVVTVSGDQTYKFGVFSTSKWEQQIKQIISGAS
jgi:hypothetical protein